MFGAVAFACASRTRAASTAGSAPALFLGRARFLERLGRDEEALAAARRVIELSGSSSEIGKAAESVIQLLLAKRGAAPRR